MRHRQMDVTVMGRHITRVLLSFVIGMLSISGMPILVHAVPQQSTETELLPTGSQQLIAATTAVQEPVILGECLAGEIFCNPNAAVVEATPRISCALNEKTVSILSIGCIPQTNQTDGAVVPWGRDIATNQWNVTPPINSQAEWVFTNGTTIVQKWLTELLGWMFSTAFGAGYSGNARLGSGQRAFATPVLYCAGAEGVAQFGCQGNMPWFVQSYSMMRTIGLYLMVPMFFLMVVQAIVKGSMQMLLRGMFVVLPTAILASVFIIVFGQLLLNISDDFSHYIADKTVTPQIMQCAADKPITTTPDAGTQPGDLVNRGAYGACVQNSLASVAATKMGALAYIWFVILLLSTIIIYIELVLREIGVYATVFFLPLAFAAMIWPAATKIAKIMLEILIGLIFSKVFVVAALSLGVSALARVKTSATVSQVAGQDPAIVNSDGGVQTLIVGTLVLMMAAFVQTKVVMMTPTAITKTQGAMYRPSNFWSKGQLANITIGRAVQSVKFGARHIPAGRKFSLDGRQGKEPGRHRAPKNSGGSPSPGSGGGTSGGKGTPPSSGTGTGAGKAAPPPPSPSGNATRGTPTNGAKYQGRHRAPRTPGTNNVRSGLRNSATRAARLPSSIRGRMQKMQPTRRKQP